MNKKALHTLEYDKIIETLTEFAYSQAAKEQCRNLLPMTDLSAVNEAQRQTDDALLRIYKKGGLSFSGVHPVGASLKRLEIGGSLSIPEFLQISSLLEVSKRAKNFGRTERDDMEKDSLDHFFETIEPLTPLNEEIKRCILSEDEISDDASSTLKSIRRSIHGMNERIRTQVNKVMNQANSSGYLQDAVITMRDGRYCIPVKAEAKNQVPGMIHDQSSSGSTLFIEPSAVVNLNNELRELFFREAKEIEVILSNLSSRVYEYAAFISDNYTILTTLDFIFAKAQLAKLHNGVSPVLNTEGRIRLRKARHPLLDPKKVVPIDVILGDTFDLLIITGPNTGGKTVSLKTAGLLTLMGQAGLHIPANDRSELSVFEDVFADIGDEQSIEQNLSTFSSHMTNIVSILKHANDKSLVLFDELCAGTDPTEGAALAISILSRLHQSGIRTMATTHYSEIKVFALSTEGVENACCEFSVETLSPTYRLLIGIPGKSNAFAISSKIGLDPSLIEDARGRITESEASFEDLLSDLEHSRVTIEREQEEIKAHKQEIAALKKKLEQKQERIEQSRDKILKEANEQAYAILKEAKDFADESIRNFHKFGQNFTTASEMEKERTRLRSKLNDTGQNLSGRPKPEKTNHKAPAKLRIGDSVKVLSMNLKGIVNTLPNAKGDLYVQMGILNSLVNIKDLVLIEESTSASAKTYSKTGAGSIKMSKSATVSAEINLIGKTTDEAIALLDKYLDDAYIAHLPSVRIVHGKGTGALRSAVQKHLKRQKYIKSFRLGTMGEGDAGVTIAEFKE
ncbi:MAG: endonuclease MutS2 [Lachnospiraceae bacterium]|nr:endonuclease MutS2 [Lachnospiraceae bacterium]